MIAKASTHDVYNSVQELGGNIDGEEIVVEYEKTNGGTKVIGGEVTNAYENYDNRNDVRKVVIDFGSYAGDWRLVAENGTVTEVTLYSRNGAGNGEIQKTRISTRDGVAEVMNADEW
jgi:hypothetical protein